MGKKYAAVILAFGLLTGALCSCAGREAGNTGKQETVCPKEGQGAGKMPREEEQPVFAQSQEEGNLLGIMQEMCDSVKADILPEERGPVFLEKNGGSQVYLEEELETVRDILKPVEAECMDEADRAALNGEWDIRIDMRRRTYGADYMTAVLTIKETAPGKYAAGFVVRHWQDAEQDADQMQDVYGNYWLSDLSADGTVPDFYGNLLSYYEWLEKRVKSALPDGGISFLDLVPEPWEYAAVVSDSYTGEEIALTQEDRELLKEILSEIWVLEQVPRTAIYGGAPVFNINGNRCMLYGNRIISEEGCSVPGPVQWNLGGENAVSYREQIDALYRRYDADYTG